MSRRARVPVTLVTAIAVATPFLPAMAGSAAAGGVPTPPTPRLPTGIERPAPYIGQEYCGPVARPGVVAFKNMVLRTYPYTGSNGIVRDCSLGGRSEHKEGRAWDWTVNAGNRRQKAAADTLISWLLAPDRRGNPAAMARRLGIMYIIWNGKVWRAYTGGWQPYRGISAHTDHVHFSFSWEGALKETSYFSGRVAARRSGPPTALPRMTYASSTVPVAAVSGPAFSGNIGAGATGTTVRLIQGKVGSTVSGWYGPVTEAAVKRYQAAHGIPATGIVGPQTWAALFGGRSSGGGASGSTFPGNIGYDARGDVVRRIQAGVGAPVSGWFGPTTRSAVQRYQAARRIPATGIVGPQTWAALFGGRSSGGGATGSTFPGNIGYDARGDVVRRIQARVGAPVSGWYGPVTVSAVTRYQAARGIPTTGIVGTRTWRALFG